jgi:hypothetical protein
MQARQLKPHTEALQALPCCGPGLQQTTVAKVVLQVGRLRQWQQQLPASARGSSSSAGMFAAGAAAASLSQQLSELQGQLLPEEYGASLELDLPEGPAALAWLMGSSSSQQQQGGAAAAAAVGSSGAVTTPGELRQLFAAEAAADDLGWGSAAAAGGGAGGDEYDVDIDSDDERKGRGKKVRQGQQAVQPE